MKNTVFIAAISLILVAVTVLFLINNRIMKENRDEIRILTAKVEKLELDLANVNKMIGKASDYAMRKGPTEVSSETLEDKLNKIQLPPNATREQTEKYIDAILDASKTQNAFTPNDIQIKMLEKIDHKYLPLLISRITDNNDPVNFHSSIAVANLVKESDKKLIIRMLPLCPKLIDSVVKFGWQKETKDVIFKTMKNNNYLPANWPVCAGQLAEPEDYEVLIGYFIRTADKKNTYDNIKNLPGIKLDSAVAMVWNANKYGPKYWIYKELALIAADFGHLDALATVIELRNDKNQYFHRIAYDKIYALTGQRGSYSQLKKWFNANKNRLVFDKTTKRYIIKKRQ